MNAVMSDPRKHSNDCWRPAPELVKIRDTEDGRTVWRERCPVCKRSAVYDLPTPGRTGTS